VPVETAIFTALMLIQPGMHLPFHHSTVSLCICESLQIDLV
jgi:hypothetical protein